MMTRALMASPERNKLYLVGIALCIVVAMTAYGQIRLNAWNRPFYDALSRKDLAAFLDQLVVFSVIASGLLILNVAQVWLNQKTKIKLREWLTRDLFDQWLEPKRAFRLAGAGEIGVHPDQRMHEDARHLVELSTDLGIGLLQATLLLASFVGVLWILSEGIVFNIHEWSFSVPGYMVWCALVYSGTASWLSWRVGRPLVHLNAERYAREADLRFSLVRVNEHATAIALYGGEKDENGRLHHELDQVLQIMRRLVSGVTRLTWITAGYGWFAIVVPIVVAAPGFFTGDISLGGLMMVVGAFNQVQQALRWFVDNFSTIADWRATLLRVASFRLALVEMDKLGHETGRIERVPSAEGGLAFDDVGISSPSGCTKLSEARVVIDRAEHVLIVGKRGVGKTNLIRAIAGLWPWGCGRVSVPPAETMMLVLQRPYIPPGTLREALAYPSHPAGFEESEFIAALDRMGLSHLSSDLDGVARWDRELTNDEQQHLAFARLLLHKPSWVLIDEALDSLDEDSRNTVLDIFRQELAETAVINIGRPDTRQGFFKRVLHLIKDPEGERLSPCACTSRLAAEKT
jgi:putative ATP-binding cassette transporter